MSIVRNLTPASYILQLVHADFAGFHADKTCSSPVERTRPQNLHSRAGGPGRTARFGAEVVEKVHTSWLANDLSGAQVAELLQCSPSHALRFIAKWKMARDDE